MAFTHYFGGVVLGVVCVGSLLLGARRLRARLLPETSGAAAWVADGVLVASLTVLALEVVGIMGALDRLGAVLGLVAVGVLAALAAGPVHPERSTRTTELRSGGSGGALAFLPTAGATIATAAVAAAWLGWTVFAYRHGMESIDTLWYHLPFAARFAQLGNILHLQYFDRDPVTVFYPGNSELIHTLGLVLFRTDLVSPLINLIWAALALTAAYAVGRPFERGPHCLIAALLVLGTPGLVDTQPGGAYNDVTCVALLLASAAMLVNGAKVGVSGNGVSLPASALAAAAAGLALGTKFTMIIPALALGVGVVAITPRGRRSRHALVWIFGLVLLGGYWYLRNAIVAGNPIPAVAVHLGPLSLSAPHVTLPTATVAQYLTHLHVWGHIFVPGLRRSLGLAWWALIIGSAAGATGALLAGRRREVRMLGAVAIASALGFLFTPQYLVTRTGVPIFFVANVRYASGPLVLGLVLLPILPALRGERAGLVWLAAALVALVFTELDPGVWPDGLGLKPFASPIHGSSAIDGAALAMLILLIAVAWLWLARRAPPLGLHSTKPVRAASVAAACAAAALTGGGWLVADSYAHARFADTWPLPKIYAWAREVRDARIGIVGLDLQYPLYGPDSSNYVQYIGAPAPHAGFRPITNCPAWRAAVNRARYGWVLVAPFGFPLVAAPAPEARWTGSSVAATPFMREGGVVLYRIRGRLDPRSCPA